MVLNELNAGHVYRHVVGPHAAGGPLLDLLARWPHSGPDEWRERIDGARVLVNGQRVDAEHSVLAGDVVEYRRPPWCEKDVPRDVSIVYDDEHLLAVAKPAGLPVLPGGGFLENTLLHLVRSAERGRESWSPAHRLGRGTSGLVIFGKTAHARAHLASVFRERRVGKLYLARVRGDLPPGRRRVVHAIGLVPHDGRQVHAARPDGKPSLTLLRVLRRGSSESLVAAVPVTGRPHQIRIHAAAAGAPLVGDPLYGVGGRPMSHARPGEGGYSLHAASLRLPHPGGGVLVLRAAAPDWARV
jgi:23S rRNA pseudouridine1911/1915/1917 synthase